jgi:hypothetical protein
MKTGGILLGFYSDGHTEITQALEVPARLPSKRTYVRNSTDANEVLEAHWWGEDSSNTVVGYVGEWHSILYGERSRPSLRDWWAMTGLARGFGKPLALVVCFPFGESQFWKFLFGRAKA